MSDGRDAIVALVDSLLEIRSEWIRSDAHMVHLLSNGMKSSQGGFERIMGEERASISRQVSNLRRKLIPAASQYLDVSLRDQVRELVNDLDPSVEGADRYGEVMLRWRHTWDGLFYDSRYEDLIPLLEHAESTSERTQRVNANRRDGEDRISPHKMTPLFSDPQTIRSACYGIANMLPMIRDDWQEGDAIKGDWILRGWSTIGDHFLSIKRSSRYEIDRLLNKIANDAGVVVLPHFDPSLRDRLTQFVQNVRPYERTDVHGDREERWHLSWDELELDEEIAFLGSTIRAFGDSYELQSITNRQIPKQVTTTDRDKTESNPVSRPDGWVKADLVSQAKEALGSFSSSTFDNIRKKSSVSSSERGGKGQQRRYSRADLGKLIQAVKTGSFRNKDKIAEAWQELLDL